MNITIAKTVEVKQVWMEKSQAQKYFGLEERFPYYQKLVSEFSKSEFKDGYLSPTYKVVLIDIKKFEAFLKWKAEKKFKTRG